MLINFVYIELMSFDFHKYIHSALIEKYVIIFYVSYYLFSVIFTAISIFIKALYLDFVKS